MKVVSHNINRKGIAESYLFSYYLYILYNSIITSLVVFFLKSIFYFKLYYAPCILCGKPSIVNIEYTNTFFLCTIVLKGILLSLAFIHVKRAVSNILTKEFIIFLFLYDIIFFLLYPFTYLMNFNYLQWYSCSISNLYSFCRSNNINVIIPLGISAFIGILIFKYLGFTIKDFIFRGIWGFISFITYCFFWYQVTT